jgi:hypothetical protein
VRVVKGQIPGKQMSRIEHREDKDGDTGVVSTSTKVKSVSLAPKSPYVKLMVGAFDDGSIKRLDDHEYVIFHKICHLMNYDNFVFLTEPVKRKIAVYRGCQVRFINQTIRDLVDKKVIAKEGSGTYMVNPKIVLRGEEDHRKEGQFEAIWTREYLNKMRRKKKSMET